MTSEFRISGSEQPGPGTCTTPRKQDHPGTGTIAIIGITIIFLLLVATNVSAAKMKMTYLGDMVNLSGYSPGSDIVYLFMTGPNLPSNGVALNNINHMADKGGFSTADVDPDGRWVYKWYTNELGGTIDAGTYTVWVADRPVDRSHLSGSNYRSIPVLLQQPGITARSSTATGALQVRTIPGGAVLSLNGEDMGVTPVTIPDLPVGVYVLVLSSPGYQDQKIQAIVTEGALTRVSVPLPVENGPLYVNTTPVGVEISIEEMQAGVSPILLRYLVPGYDILDTRKPGYTASNQEVGVLGDRMIPVQQTLGEGTPPPGIPPPVTVQQESSRKQW
ncbi:MAG: PEGA domain-containing protein [Methanomicrobiales archaeon]